MNKIRNNVVLGNFIVDEKEISKYYADIKELLIQDGENVDCFTTKEDWLISCIINLLMRNWRKNIVY